MSKCKKEFGKSEVKYLGYIVGSTRLQVDQEKVYSVKVWPKTINIKVLQQLLGFFKY